MTGLRTTLRYVPSIVASFTIGQTFNWRHCTPVRQPIQPTPQPECLSVLNQRRALP